MQPASLRNENKKGLKRLTVRKIDTQIDKVDGPWTDVLNVLNEIPRGHLVRNVLDHHRRPGVLTALDPLHAHLIFFTSVVVGGHGGSRLPACLAGGQIATDGRVGWGS